MAKSKSNAVTIEKPAAEAKPDPREAEWLEAGNPRLEAEDDTVEATPAQGVKLEPEKPEAPPPPKHSRRQILEAGEWLPHLSRAEIDAIDGDVLDEMIYSAQRQYRVASERQNEAIRQREQQIRPEPEADDFDDEFKDWDDNSKRALKKIDTRKEVAALKKQIEELQGDLRKRDQQTFHQRLQAKSREHKLSAKQTAATIGVLQSLERLDLTNLDHEFDEAVRELGFGKKEEPKPAKPSAAQSGGLGPEDEPDDMDRELEARKKQWQEGGLAKSTQRGEDLPPGKERFIREWNRKRREAEQSDEDFEREYGLNGK